MLLLNCALKLVEEIIRDMNVVRLSALRAGRIYPLPLQEIFLVLLFFLRTIRTPIQGKSIKLIQIIHHFPYNVIFLLYLSYFYYILLYFIILYYTLLYFILFIAKLHMRPHLPKFFHNNTVLYSILSS